MMGADDVRISIMVSDNVKGWLKKQSLLMNWDIGKVISRLVARSKVAGYEAPNWAWSGGHHHKDPCDDEACPCRKAEADDWREKGLARP